MNPSPQNNPSRRTVLKSIGATTTLAASGLLPSSIYAAPSTLANDKLRVGLIGAGNRAKWLTRALSRESHRAELVAVCDCYLPQIDALAADNKSNPKAGAAWKRYQNYEQMFDQEEFDAVIIATPDHVRVRAAIIACAKGLDVYAEKPLSFSIPEGRALVKSVRKHKRILQVGTQQRSTANNQYSCKFVRDGGLGKVHTIHVMNYSGSRGATGLEKQAVPEGMNWNRFCDQAPLLDYHEQLHRRCLAKGASMLSHLLYRSDRTKNQRYIPTFAIIAISLCCGTAFADDWTILFDGNNLDGWKASRDNTQFAIVDGVILGTSSSQTQFLHTVESYGDFELELDVKLHDTDLNSGVQIRTSLTRSSDKGQSRESIHGPQVDLGKSPGRSGHLFNQGNGARITPKEDLTRNERMTNGEWNKLSVLAVGPRIQTWINGKQVADVTDNESYARYPSGVIALQVHGVQNAPENARHVSFRSIRVRQIEATE